MANIVKCQARTRIGMMRVRSSKNLVKPRTIGETFELNLDDPYQKQAYHHLIANGAIKILSGGSAKKSKVEREAPPIPAPLVEPEDLDESSESDYVTEELEPVEPIVESDQLEESEYQGLDTLLVDAEGIDFLTETQLDTLRRIGVVTVRDIGGRDDNELKSVERIGKTKVEKLRAIYEKYEAEDAEV